MLTRISDSRGKEYEATPAIIKLMVDTRTDFCILGGDYDGTHCMAALSFDLTKRGKMMALVQFDEANKLHHPKFEEDLYAALIEAGCAHIAKFVV